MSICDKSAVQNLIEPICLTVLQKLLLFCVLASDPVDTSVEPRKRRRTQEQPMPCDQVRGIAFSLNIRFWVSPLQVCMRPGRNLGRYQTRHKLWVKLSDFTLLKWPIVDGVLWLTIPVSKSASSTKSKHLVLERSQIIPSKGCPCVPGLLMQRLHESWATVALGWRNSNPLINVSAPVLIESKHE